MKTLRIVHAPTNTLIAEGPLGWGIMPFEGNLYVRKRFLATDAFRVNFVPGLCFYKFLYVWLDLLLPDGARYRSLAWMYWLFESAVSLHLVPGRGAALPSRPGGRRI